MGFRFRRSLKIVPGVRLNLSGSGASVSLGGRGFRYTIGSKGTRTTVGIPGSGISWTAYQPYAAQKPSRQNVLRGYSIEEIPPLIPIESADVAAVVKNSTHQLAPLLIRRNARPRLGFPSFFVVISICAGLHIFGFMEIVLPVFVAGLIGSGFLSILDRFRKSVALDYRLSGEALTNFNALLDSFRQLIQGGIWQTQAQGTTHDWKRNAGANVLTKRKAIFPQFGRPKFIRASITFPVFKLQNEEVYFTPDSVLIVAVDGVAILRYSDLFCELSTTRFIESEGLPNDALVLGQTWAYVNKQGGPDRRFNNNRQMPICLYGELTLKSSGGLNQLIQISNPNSASRLLTELETTKAFNENQELFSTESGVFMRPPSKWPTLLSWSTIILFWACLAGGVFYKTNGFAIWPTQNKSAQISNAPYTPTTNSIFATEGLASKSSVPLPKTRPPMNLLPVLPK